MTKSTNSQNRAITEGMKRDTPLKPSIGVLGGLIVSFAILLTITAFSVRGAEAQDIDAGKILRAMSNYVTTQKTISMTFDTDIEIITPDLQKIQFTNSGSVLLSRPDKLHATRTGGYADVELVFDGKMLTVLGKNINMFTQIDAPGSVDELIDGLRSGYGVAAPGADLLLSRVFDELISDVIDAKHIGRGVIDGIECEHLAFRNPEIDWQIWVEVGARPIPRKYVITSKTMAGAPQYTLRIKEWRTDVQTASDAFAFKPPPGAMKVALDALSGLDEVPPGIPTGARK